MAAQRHWRLEAACAEVDPELFFPDRGDPALAAKRICGGCPVQAQCLEFALAVGETNGVWGGLSSKQRRPFQRVPVEIHLAATPPSRSDAA